MRKIADEYLTAAAGPTSHSPPPIEVAAMIAPGPMTENMFRKLKGGGAGRSLTSHGGSSPCVGGSKSRDAVARPSAVEPDGVGMGILVLRDYVLRPPAAAVTIPASRREQASSSVWAAPSRTHPSSRGRDPCSPCNRGRAGRPDPAPRRALPRRYVRSPRGARVF